MFCATTMTQSSGREQARACKGHIVTAEDIPVLLSMGKEQLYVWELQPGFLHENDAAERLCALCQNANMHKKRDQRGAKSSFLRT